MMRGERLIGQLGLVLRGRVGAGTGFGDGLCGDSSGQSAFRTASAGSFFPGTLGSSPFSVARGGHFKLA